MIAALLVTLLFVMNSGFVLGTVASVPWNLVPLAWEEVLFDDVFADFQGPPVKWVAGKNVVEEVDAHPHYLRLLVQSTETYVRAALGETLPAMVTSADGMAGGVLGTRDLGHTGQGATPIE